MGMMFKSICCFIVICVCVLVAHTTSNHVFAQGTSPITGFAIIGDSAWDEYRGTDNRGGAYANTTFNRAELLQRFRGVNLGPWGTRAEPRRTGYEYLWARSGATTGTMISQGQHTGVAQQIRDGKVSHVIIWIGANDFATNNTIFAIYEGTLSGANLQNFLNQMLANIRTAATTVEAAGPQGMIIASVVDYAKASQFTGVEYFPDPVKRQRITNAINTLNSGISQIAQENGAVYVDLDTQVQAKLITRLDGQGFLNVGSEKIDVKINDPEPHHALIDQAHAGTVMSGLMANYELIQTFNANFGTSIAEFTDQEILQNAGIQVSATATPGPTATPVSCATDLNSDRFTDISDYSILVAHFFQSNPANPKADINKDGFVDITDYSLLVANFFKNC